MRSQTIPDARERTTLFGRQTLEQGRRGQSRGCSCCEGGLRNGRNPRHVRGRGEGGGAARALENTNGFAHLRHVDESQKIAGLKVGRAKHGKDLSLCGDKMLFSKNEVRLGQYVDAIVACKGWRAVTLELNSEQPRLV